MTTSSCDVLILGSGTPIPDPHRAGSGVALLGADTWILVDCGRGVTQRALDAGLDLTAVAAVLLTHQHSDHLSDLPNLAITRWVAGAATPLAVIAPAGPAAQFAERCLDAYDDSCFYGQSSDDARPRPQLAVTAIVAESMPSALDLPPPWTAQVALVEHPPVEPAVGYRLSDGQVSVAISGDTRVCDSMDALATGADVLIHETVLSKATPVSLQAWNADARSVGALAQRCDVGTLILTHMLPAPRDGADESRFVAEAREGGYSGPIRVAHDGARLSPSEVGLDGVQP